MDGLPSRPACPAGAGAAVQAWNLMGGLDWNALPIVVEMLGVDDVEALVHHLVTIRNHMNEAD